MTRVRNAAFRILPALTALPLAACTVGVGDDTPGNGTAYFERIYLQDKFNTAVRGDRDIAEAALDYVAEQNEITESLSLGDNFLVRSKLVGMDGLHHVRMAQAYDGIPVWGADITVHASSEVFRSVNGALVKQLEGFDTTTVLTEDDAVAISHEDYAILSKDPGATLEYSRQEVELVIYPQAERTMKLAYHVQFYTELQADINPGLWNYFVDAQTGEILDQFNGIHTAAGDIVLASGPGGNAKHANSWNGELDVYDNGNGTYKMDTPDLRTVNMNKSQSGNGTVVTGSDLNNFGDAAINDAHGYGRVTLDMMLQWYGYDSLNEQGFLIKSRVHYGNNYENAFWDGTQMTYGDGASYFYALSGGLDVVAHEFNHGFTSFHSNLTYSGQSGGLNESFSDIVGTIAEFYREPETADWLLGEDVFQNPNGALRYMCNPPQDGKSIGHASDYTNGMDVHYSSGVSNKAFCRAAKRFASGDPEGTATQASVRRAGQAWYLANASYWTASTNFIGGCQGVMDAANALGFSEQERTWLIDSWGDVGVACDGAPQPVNCDVTLTDESGTFTSPNHPANYPNNVDHTWCIEPASGSPVTLTFDAFNTEANYDFVEIKDANGALVSKTSGTTAPPDATSTKLVVKFTSDGSVVRAGFSASFSTGAVQNVPPTVAISAPADGETVSGTVAITADAVDSDGTIASVTFTLPDGTTSTDTSAPYSASWNSTTAPDGLATISVVAADNLGATASASVTVTVANGTDCADGTYDAADVPQNIPDNTNPGITSTIAVSGAGTVQSLALSLNISHTYRGDLIVTLTSPAGTSYTVHNGSGGSADNLVINNLAITNFAGQNAAGNWTLSVRDRYAADVGTLNSWSIDIVADCGGGGGPGNWSGSASPNMATVDNGSACTSLTVAGSGDASGVLLSLSGTHGWRSILRATLEHNGVTVEAFPTGTFASNSGSFSLTDRAISGLSGDAAGTWTLCIIDTDAYGDTGNLATWSVHN